MASAAGDIGAIAAEVAGSAVTDAQIRALAAEATNRSARYLFTSFLDVSYPGTADITSFGGTGEAHIRLPAAVAFTLATLLATGEYDPAITGRTEAQARTQAVRLLRSLAALHKSHGGPWGGRENTGPQVGANGGWQETLWAELMGGAAWLLRDTLTAAEMTSVVDVVVWEANRLVPGVWSIEYWKNAAGTELFPGDSKSEEIAWNASCLVVALLLAPTHANRGKWQTALVRAGLAHNAIPADLADTVPVNGTVPAEFLTGTNMLPDGTIINHGILHPNYMVSAASSLYGSFALASLGGIEVPVAAERHADLIWTALTDRDFRPGSSPYARGGRALPPGGTIYPWPASADIYYPQGTDHQAPRIEDKAIFDICAYRYGWDRASRPGAGYWAVQHLTRQIELQARFTTGQTYGPGEGGSVGAECVVAQNLAHGLLTIIAPPAKMSTAGVVDTSSYPAAVKSLMPYLWLRLDESGGTTLADASGNEQPMTLTGAAPTFGRPSLVPTDPGGKSVQVTAALATRAFQPWMQVEFSAAAVFRRPAAPAAAGMLMGRISVGNGNDANGREWGIQINSDGKAQMFVYKASDFSIVSVATTAVSVCDGAAHLLACTVTRDGAWFYLDGQLVGSWTGKPNLNSTSILTVFGRNVNGGLQTGLDGDVDEVFIVAPMPTAQHQQLRQAFSG